MLSAGGMLIQGDEHGTQLRTLSDRSDPSDGVRPQFKDQPVVDPVLPPRIGG